MSVICEAITPLTVTGIAVMPTLVHIQFPFESNFEMVRFRVLMSPKGLITFGSDCSQMTSESP